MWIFSLRSLQGNIQLFLQKRLDKKEIQEGLIKACDVIDLIIEILRGSKNREAGEKMSDGRVLQRESILSQRHVEKAAGEAAFF